MQASRPGSSTPPSYVTSVWSPPSPCSRSTPTGRCCETPPTWLTSTQDPANNAGETELDLDWNAWGADVDAHGRRWSPTEYKLFHVVAAVATTRPLAIVGVLDFLNDWHAPVWAVLHTWASGGDTAAIRFAGGTNSVGLGSSTTTRH